MTVRTLVLSGGRSLSILMPNQARSISPGRPFATLLPAFCEEERRQAETNVAALIDLGCVEFCCVGPEAEFLHDSIDRIIEEKGALDIVTTWHSDYIEASDYFLYAAGGKLPTLLALVASHSELVALLESRAGGG